MILSQYKLCPMHNVQGYFYAFSFLLRNFRTCKRSYFFFNSLNFYSLKIFKILDIFRKASVFIQYSLFHTFFTNINIIECYTMPIENCRSITREVKRIGLKIQLQNLKRRKIDNFQAFFKYYLRIL